MYRMIVIREIRSSFYSYHSSWLLFSQSDRSNLHSWSRVKKSCYRESDCIRPRNLHEDIPPSERRRERECVERGEHSPRSLCSLTSLQCERRRMRERRWGQSKLVTSAEEKRMIFDLFSHFTNRICKHDHILESSSILRSSQLQLIQCSEKCKLVNMMDRVFLPYRKVEHEPDDQLEPDTLPHTSTPSRRSSLHLDRLPFTWREVWGRWRTLP